MKKIQRVREETSGEDASPGDLSDPEKKTPGKTPRKSPQTTDGSTEEYKPKVTLSGELTYYIGGGNGNAIIEEIMNDLGWRRIKDKLDESYTLKWCELKQAINYNSFKEGEQLVNHIPNCNLLTNKLGLLNSLQEYSRVCGAMKKRVPKLDFIPETYKLDDPKEKELFRDIWKDDEVWICKPTGRNQGKGIFLVKSRDEMEQVLQDSDDRSQLQQQGKSSKPMNRIIQRYIHNPLLLDNKKFDIRCYMLVGSTCPYLVLYHPGYIRLSLFEYENNYDNIAVHLTNQFIQKKEACYKDMKEDTVWSMERFNDYVNENYMEDKGIEKDWVEKILPARIKQIMSYCFNAVKHRLNSRVGYFDLYGFDFMVDANMKVWLIEVNVNPCLATNCEVLKEVVPPVVKESIYIAIDCFEKARKGRSIMPCQAIKTFEVLFHGAGSSTKSSSPSRQRTGSVSPIRRPRTISPTKEMTQHSANSYSQLRYNHVAPTSTNMYTSKPTNLTTFSQVGAPSKYSIGYTRSGYNSDRYPPGRSVQSTSDRPQYTRTSEKAKPDAVKGDLNKAPVQKSIVNSTKPTPKSKDSTEKSSPKDSPISTASDEKNNETKTKDKKTIASNVRENKVKVTKTEDTDALIKSNDGSSIKNNSKTDDKISLETKKEPDKVVASGGASTKKIPIVKIGAEKGNRGS